MNILLHLLFSCILTFGLGLNFAMAQTTSPKAALPDTDTPATADLPLEQHELMYHIMVAELAARRGALEQSLEHYRAAALGSNDARVSERAASIALFINNNIQLLELAQHWQTLTPEQPQAMYTLALAYLRNNQVDAAIPLLNDLIHLDQDKQRAHARLANLLSQLEDSGLIMETMTKILALHPLSRHALFNHAIAALNAELPKLAIDSLNRAISVAPDWREAHLLRARVRLQINETELGLQALQETVAQYPDNTELRMGYARLLVSADQMDAARQQFQLIANKNPQDGEALFALGVLALEAEEFAQAREYYQQVLELGHRVLDVYYELGRTEELAENYSAAQEWYQRITDGERYINAQIRAAAMAAKQGDMDEMVVQLGELRRANPDEAIRIYQAQADILRDAGEYEQAFATYNTALQEFPDNHDLLYGRALAAERIDKLDVLEADLRQIIANDPDNGHALNALGYTLADRTDRYQEAKELLERAIVLLPKDPAVLDSMGWVYYRLGELEKALDYLKQAFKINQDGEIVSHYAEVLLELGQTDKARIIWQEALEKEPDNRFLLRLQDRFEQKP